ncbi:uncharacterized protein LOC126906270 [Daktulosphaira vitifoliae]|uniref:uncharacterized protein LOC126906270 n=1 Tax=Daktulosphaira vitifoliae TaxID=58002 RepID=UPI0021AB0485|nr:uncharacterized protein LOC126906270 [Daktulosphaira vitifoliae]XP_050542671.1 uncharacterized protein LOC126906270 [Daktulosphaira vitifoliae]
MKFMIIILLLTHDVLITNGAPYNESEMSPCPKIKPFTQVKVDQLLGKWYLAIMIMESFTEEFVEDNVCIHGELLRYNTTMLKQIWNVDNPMLMEDHSAVIDLPTIEIENNIWSIQSPLGGEIHTTIINAEPDNHAILVFCGLRGLDKLHMWTAVVTRKNGISAPETLRLSAILVKHGYDPRKSKIISWSNCPAYKTI